MFLVNFLLIKLIGKVDKKVLFDLQIFWKSQISMFVYTYVLFHEIKMLAVLHFFPCFHRSVNNRKHRMRYNTFFSVPLLIDFRISGFKLVHQV